MMENHKSVLSPSTENQGGNKSPSKYRSTKSSVPLFVQKQLIKDIEFVYTKGIFAEDFKLKLICDKNQKLYGAPSSVRFEVCSIISVVFLNCHVLIIFFIDLFCTGTTSSDK